ncbi:purine-nucleoside phosphorylase [Brucella gallinifaecis]|uniref:Purine nucleoside permease n=1 Tax=Brucella gallinifaecis TaxID=215590 RepID=A0A502BQQ3_9HYPH|nr:purine nucleoside permease [Brucella gallinifaecis]TPF76534.1 purine nucleoside permease [Brucella gallinifaecis]
MKPSLHTSILSAYLLATAIASPAFAQGTQTIAPKVMVITMFGEEAKPWLQGEKFTQKLKLPGLSTEYPEIDCTAEGLCHMTTAMGFANAASSVSAMALSDKLDLKHTYFLIAGIAGVDPEHGTLGSAHWAKYAVDANLNHRIDIREAPEGWATDFFGLGASKPGEKPKWAAGTEVFELNGKLADYALATTQGIELLDSDDAREYRKHYTQEAATNAPKVTICDTASADTYWHGTKLAEATEQWTKLLTDGKGEYCTSQMEDNATLTALKRAAEAGKLDFNRVALLRTASNFDRQGKDQSAAESLSAKSGGFPLATTNAYRVGKTYADSIINDWKSWEQAPQTDAK